MAQKTHENSDWRTPSESYFFILLLIIATEFHGHIHVHAHGRNLLCRS
jgi:hypothetical protein